MSSCLTAPSSIFFLLTILLPTQAFLDLPLSAVVCYMPLDSGVSTLEGATCIGQDRYYYQQTLGWCSKFWYRGCGGNNNNFLTLSSCMAQCGPDANPCDQPLAVGGQSCAPTLSLRYYFDCLTGECKLFLYQGCDGNDNNFLTIYECVGQCMPIPDQPSGFDIRAAGSLPDANILTLSTGLTEEECAGVCDRNRECGAAEWVRADPPECYTTTLESAQSVPVPNDASILYVKANLVLNICNLPVVKGPCSAIIYRWYFNPLSGQCEKFQYSGCGGNANNFETQADCEERCIGEDDPCWQPVVAGPCLAYFPRYFFNTVTRQCEGFIYGGCGGNANNFLTLQACQATCRQPDVKPKPKPKPTPTPRPRPSNPCYQPSDPGPCDGYIPRYYYNYNDDECEKFYYGGCDGNRNNFETRDECDEWCRDSSGSRSRSDDDDGDKDTTIAIVVVVVILVVIIIIILICYCHKKGKKFHRRNPVVIANSSQPCASSIQPYCPSGPSFHYGPYGGGGKVVSIS